MQLIRTPLVGLATLALAACSTAGDDGRSSAKISEIEWTTQSSGQTTLGRVEINYESDRLKEATFRINGEAAGRMEFDYGGTRLDAIDVTDADGDRASYQWEYEDGRLASIRLVAQQLVAFQQEFEYDDANGGRPRRTTSTSWPGPTANTTVETYDYDDAGRLEEIEAIDGTTTWSSELRYDEASRIERFTSYAGGGFTDADLSYDAAGRLVLVESSDSDRHEITYGDGGLIAEILILSPTSGVTKTIEYRYVEGTVDGLTFNPELPLAGLIDLGGLPYDQAEFTALTPPLVIGNVDVGGGGGGDDDPVLLCAHDVCVSGTALSQTCDSCAAAVCAQDSFCCSSSWDATCVSLVAGACGFSC